MSTRSLFIGMIILTILAASSLSGCNSLSEIEKKQYDNLINQGIATEEEKSKTLSALLNILPGVGDIVNGEWGAFALDFLLWPVSVVWAIPQGAITAGNINKKATIAKHLYDEYGNPKPFTPGTE